MEGRPPDNELVRRALRGDHDAYRQIVTLHQDIAFRIAFLITRSEEDARDATQDGFVKAFGALGRFDRSRPLRPWLLQIIGNEARNRARSTGRRTAMEMRVAAAEPSGDAAPSPEDIAMAAERRHELLAAMATLADDQRAVLELRYFGGLSEAETAAALGIRLGTVKSRHARALERLRSAMEATNA